MFGDFSSLFQVDKSRYLCRVYLDYHTNLQVNVGLVVGILYGIFWYIVTLYLRTYKITDLILDLAIMKFFFFKDSYTILDVLKLEYIDNQKYTNPNKDN